MARSDGDRVNAGSGCAQASFTCAYSRTVRLKSLLCRRRWFAVPGNASRRGSIASAFRNIEARPGPRSIAASAPVHASVPTGRVAHRDRRRPSPTNTLRCRVLGASRASRELSRFRESVNCRRYVRIVRPTRRSRSLPNPTVGSSVHRNACTRRSSAQHAPATLDLDRIWRSCVLRQQVWQGSCCGSCSGGSVSAASRSDQSTTFEWTAAAGSSISNTGMPAHRRILVDVRRLKRRLGTRGVLRCASVALMLVATSEQPVSTYALAVVYPRESHVPVVGARRGAEFVLRVARHPNSVPLFWAMWRGKR